MSLPLKKFRDPKDYFFELKDIERWFNLLLKEGKITSLTPQEPIRPEDKKDGNFCRYHQRVHHPTAKCYKVWEIIQDFFDKGLLKYCSKSEDKGKATSSIMMATHDALVDLLVEESNVVTIIPPSSYKQHQLKK